MKKNGKLSLEQLRQKLHISKRKAAWMLQNAVIPCRIVVIRTHLRYHQDSFLWADMIFVFAVKGLRFLLFYDIINFKKIAVLPSKTQIKF